MLNKELLLATESKIAGHIKLTVGERSGTFGYFEDLAGMMGTIGKITDTIVPMSAICPTPMAKYNAWVAPTNTPATGA